MAALRRGQQPMSLDVSTAQSSDLPLISALFLIYFDIKAGYTILWKRALPGVDLEGDVEYKSLPSGLHTVKEDLIYYVHEKYAGLSAFINAPASEETRNARMIAVGVLVPLSYGRLGRSWKHAENLKNLAQKLISHPDDTEVLEDYWQSHRARDGIDPSHLDLDSPSSLVFKPLGNRPGQNSRHTRNRSASDGTALIPPGHNLSLHHPAWSLSTLLDTFGPLIFPIYRAALLRKRILISCHAPVQQACDFVYDLSVLSNIPIAVSELLADSAPPTRLRPLFTIGVHDIPLLDADLHAQQQAERPVTGDSSSDYGEELGHGWIACTTDGILALKDTLYDVLITLPPPSHNDLQEGWPKVESPRGTLVKATQRDLRRYRSLRWGLSRSIPSPTSPSLDRTNGNLRRRSSTPPNPTTSNSATTASPQPSKDSPLSLSSLPDTDPIIEPLSWSALAYTGFLWWASAGEHSISLDSEGDHDAALLEGLNLEPSPQSARQNSPFSFSAASITTNTFPSAYSQNANKELAIIAYFHRLTTQILSTLSDVIDATDSDDENDAIPLTNNEDNGGVVDVRSEDMICMGLDEWSEGDQKFVVEMAEEYFGRRARVDGRTFDVCGVRIC